MTSVERLARVMRPAPARRGSRLDIGDGDLCVTNPEHGHMYTVGGFARQWCAHHAHDVTGALSRWPYRPHSDFVAAVEAYEATQVRLAAITNRPRAAGGTHS